MFGNARVNGRYGFFSRVPGSESIYSVGPVFDSLRVRILPKYIDFFCPIY